MRHVRLVGLLFCAAVAGCLSDAQKEEQETLAMRGWQAMLAIRFATDELNPGFLDEIAALEHRPDAVFVRNIDRRDPMGAAAIRLMQEYLEQVESARQRYLEACRRRFDDATCNARAWAIQADPSAALRIARSEGFDYHREGSHAGRWIVKAASDLSIAPHWRAPPP